MRSTILFLILAACAPKKPRSDLYPADRLADVENAIEASTFSSERIEREAWRLLQDARDKTRRFEDEYEALHDRAFEVLRNYDSTPADIERMLELYRTARREYFREITRNGVDVRRTIPREDYEKVAGKLR